MNSDLTADTGPLEPGLSELFQSLTAAPEHRERAGEQAALTMFRENRQPAAGQMPGRARSGGASARFRRWPDRKAGVPVRWSVRVAAAATVAVTGGFAAAAYASVLPAPVQHVAYRVLGFAGVPDVHHDHANSAPPGSHPTGAAGGHRHHSSAPGSPSPSPAQTRAASPKPGAGASASPTPSSGPAGPDSLSASAPSGQITAGASVVISGTLTNPAGAGVAGTRVRLLERPGLQQVWRVAGVAQSNSSGNVAVTVPVLGVNAAFELASPGGITSPVVTITVLPPVDTQLVLGAKGVHDVLVVSTEYAHRGNIVVLQKQLADGTWVSLRVQRLNVNGKARFLLNGRNLGNEMIRVMLLATPRHGASTSVPVSIPPPVD